MLITLALVSGSNQLAKAQSQDTVRFDYLTFYVFGQVAVPSKEFREVINNSVGDLGVGLSGGFLFSPFGQKKPSPILLGVDIGGVNYGVDKISASSSSPPIKISHNIFSFDAVARLRPPDQHNKIVTPFVDGMLGLKMYNTRVKIDKDLLDVLFNNDQAEVLDNVNNSGLNFGLGAGFYTPPQNSRGAAFILRAMYLWGDQIDYVVRNSVKYNNGTLTYQSATANTSMFLIQLGISGWTWRSMVKAE